MKLKYVNNFALGQYKYFLHSLSIAASKLIAIQIKMKNIGEKLWKLNSTNCMIMRSWMLGLTGLTQIAKQFARTDKRIVDRKFRI